MVSWKRVGLFLCIAFALATGLSLPLWLDPRKLQAPHFKAIAVIVMATPAIAAWLTQRILGDAGTNARDAFGWHKPQAARSSVALALLLPLSFSLASLAVAMLLGLYAFDFGLSGLATQMGGKLPMPASLMIAISVFSALPGSFINAIPALGEELGWRGFLRHELRNLTPLWADVGTGLVWGLWHAPLILLGYNYPSAPVLGAFVLMPVQCVVLSIWIGYLTRRASSVWIAALAHGATNATASLVFLFARANQPIDTVHVSVTGWSGWLVPIAVCVFLGVTGRLRSSRQADLSATPA